MEADDETDEDDDDAFVTNANTPPTWSTRLEPWVDDEEEEEDASMMLETVEFESKLAQSPAGSASKWIDIASCPSPPPPPPPPRLLIGTSRTA
jgi:hypothetical protein